MEATRRAAAAQPSAEGTEIAAGATSAGGIPGLVSALYGEMPARLRVQLLECLLRPVGPLAIVTISAGAFAHMLYRLRWHGMPVTLDDVARIQPEHVAELAAYVVQASPETLLRIGTLIANTPVAVATVAGTALLAALRSLRPTVAG